MFLVQRENSHFKNGNKWSLTPAAAVHSEHSALRGLKLTGKTGRAAGRWVPPFATWKPTSALRVFDVKRLWECSEERGGPCLQALLPPLGLPSGLLLGTTVPLGSNEGVCQLWEESRCFRGGGPLYLQRICCHGKFLTQVAWCKQGSLKKDWQNHRAASLRSRWVQTVNFTMEETDPGTRNGLPRFTAASAGTAQTKSGDFRPLFFLLRLAAIPLPSTIPSLRTFSASATQKISLQS